MKKYFVISDIHGFYSVLKKELKKVGFYINNPEHILIVCGDIFDRGKQPLQIYKFLKSLPKERRILIRGNHEYLLRDLVERTYPLFHDIHNGTYDTLCYISKQLTNEQFENQTFKIMYNDDKYNDWDNYMQLLHEREEENLKRLKKIFNNKKVKEILNWIFSDEWINYYETDKYIFVHAWFPMIGNQGYRVYYKALEYDNNWRNADSEKWEEASWGCPIDYYLNGHNKTGKTIVCGHWHTSDFWNNLDYEKDLNKKLSTYNCPLYKSDKFTDLIGLDACTVVSKKINVLVLNENEV